MGNVQDDFTDLVPTIEGASKRSFRSKTTRIVLHRIGGKLIWPTAADVINFFTKEPEGVATVTLRGSYRDKLPTINKWRKIGVPSVYAQNAFVGYHFLVDPDGVIYRTLPIDAVGAHVSGVNSTSVGIGVIGDFRSTREVASWETKTGRNGGEMPTDDQLAGLGVLLDCLLNTYPNAAVCTHDDVRKLQGKPPKHCPGDNAVVLFANVVSGLC